MDQSNMNIDEKDVVFDILTRLPAKSLMRFMCISKSWYDLISRDSCFIRLHLQFQKAYTDPILFLPYPKESKSNDASIDYLSLGTSKHRKIRFPWKRPWVHNRKRMYDPYRALSIAGHCNGVVCISDVHRVILWNPLIRRFKILPDTDDFNLQLESKTIYGHQSDVETVIGFGFVPASSQDNDTGHEFYYKVVRMTYTNDRGSLSRPDYPSIGELYDSRTDSWRRIADEDVQCISIKEFTNNSTFIDGSLYWLGERYRTKEEEEASNSDFPYSYPKITALNLVDEKLRNIKLPDEFDMETNFGKKIAVLGESQLGLFAGDHRHTLLLTVWATKVDKLSWTKLFRINLQADPLCFSRNGEVLLRMKYTHLVLFDPKLHAPCHFRDLGHDANHVVDYVESLLLLDGERGEEEEPNSVEETEEAEEVDSSEGALDLFD